MLLPMSPLLSLVVRLDLGADGEAKLLLLAEERTAAVEARVDEAGAVEEDEETSLLSSEPLRVVAAETVVGKRRSAGETLR
jgi:hypothetical protein